MKRIIIIVLCVVIIMGILYVFYKDQYKQKNENKTILWKKNTDENNFSAEMNKNNFFKLIMDVPDWKAKNDEDILKPLINYLSNRPDEEIYAFHDIMNELLYNLDTRENFEIAKKYYNHSDDSFLYSRCVALINGKEYYDKVSKHKVDDLWIKEFETILSVPMLAWQIKYKQDISNYPHVPLYCCETGSNKNGWK